MFLRIFFRINMLSLFCGTVVYAEDNPSLLKAGNFIFRKSNLDRFTCYVHQFAGACQERPAETGHGKTADTSENYSRYGKEGGFCYCETLVVCYIRPRETNYDRFSGTH